MFNKKKESFKNYDTFFPPSKIPYDGNLRLKFRIPKGLGK